MHILKINPFTALNMLKNHLFFPANHRVKQFSILVTVGTNISIWCVSDDLNVSQVKKKRLVENLGIRNRCWC